VAAYSDAAACGSLDAANDKCQNGDVVLVKGSAYAAQILSGSNGRSSACTFQAAQGETVTVASLQVQGGANWLTFRDMADRSGERTNAGTTCDTSVCLSGDHVTLDNFDITGPFAHIDFEDATNTTWQNSEMGTKNNTTSIDCHTFDPEPVVAAGGSNILIDHNTFWQFQGDHSGCEIHLETMRLFEGINGITISNNFFAPGSGDDTARISSSCVDPSSCTENRNVHVINNYFGELQAGHAAPDVFFGDRQSCVGWVIAYNFLRNGVWDNCGSESNMVAVGNMGTNTGGCVVQGVNSRNLWSASSHGSCAGDSWVAGSCSNYVCDYSSYALAADGWHLTASSPSINAGENTYCSQYKASPDMDGKPRAGVCDAGPDEYGN